MNSGWESKHSGRYWQKLEGRVVCRLCPRECSLAPGQRGLCFVRAADEDGIILTTYGRSSGFCIDPMEKKPLNHFLPGSAILSFGTAGCNLTCKFCQNWDISKARDFDRLNSIAMPQDIAKAARANNCQVAFTYNDPVIFLEYAVDTAKACHELGVRTVAVTAGYIQKEPREEFFAHMDAANIDLKSFNPDFYRRLCGAELAPVLETLCYVKKESKCWLEITTLLIPGENDSPEEIQALSEWIARELGEDTPLHLSAFHPAWKMPDRPRTPPETLLRARKIAREAGLYYVYTGNIQDIEGSTTYCPQCGVPVIGRNGYEICLWALNHGHCPKCAQVISGVFAAQPGNWGAKRQQI